MLNIKQTLNIQYYKTNVGVFFKLSNAQHYDKLMSKCSTLNNIPSESIIEIRQGWYKIEDIPTTAQRIIPSKAIQVGWELITPSIASSNIPMNLDMEQLFVDYSCEEDEMLGEYSHLASLYKPKYESQPEVLQDLEVVGVCIGELEISDYAKPESMLVKFNNNSDKVTSVDLSSVVKYEEIEELLTPEFLLHKRPCYLSSEQMYRIVRTYVQENINFKEARVTSNYDFCFTIKKVLHKPSLNKKKVQDEELFEVFEMTHSGSGGNYKGYTAIKALHADSLVDMKNKLGDYLNNLLSVINSKVEQCFHCGGTGHIVSKVNTNFSL